MPATRGILIFSNTGYRQSQRCRCCGEIDCNKESERSFGVHVWLVPFDRMVERHEKPCNRHGYHLQEKFKSKAGIAMGDVVGGTTAARQVMKNRIRSNIR